MESNMELMVLKLRKWHFQFQNHHKIKPQASKTYNWTQNQNEKIPELKQQKQLKTTKGKSFTVFSSGHNFSCPQIWKNRRYKEKRVERTQCVQILDLNSCFSTSSVLNKEAKLSVHLWSVVMSPEAHCWSFLTFNGKEPTRQCRRYKRPRFNCWVGKIPWKRKWQPTQVFLPGESYRQRSLAGYSPWDHNSQTWLSDLPATNTFWEVGLLYTYVCIYNLESKPHLCFQRTKVCN